MRKHLKYFGIISFMLFISSNVSSHQIHDDFHEKVKHGYTLIDGGKGTEAFALFMDIFEKEQPAERAYAAFFVACFILEERGNVDAIETLMQKHEKGIPAILKRDFLMMRARARFNAARYSESLLDVDKCLEMNQKDDDARYLKAKNLSKIGKTKESIELLETLQEKKGGHSDSAVLLAKLYYREGNYGKSYKTMMNYYSIHDPDYFVLGSLAQKARLYSEAVRWFEKKLDSDPEHVVTRFNLSLALWDLDKKDEAKKHISYLRGKNAAHPLVQKWDRINLQ